MSRGTTQGQLTTRSRKLFVTPSRRSDGIASSLMSSQSLSGQSVQINHARNSGALFLLMTLLENQTFDNQPGVGCSVIAAMCLDVWKNILCFIIGSQKHNELENVGYYALALTRPVSIFQNATLYSYIDSGSYLITNAAIRGEEYIVLNILNADPSYLLKIAVIKNSVDVVYGEFDDPDPGVTPLQAAIMVNDVQLIEHMKPYFERLTDSAGNPIDGLSEMKRQMIEIYKKSLRHYFDLTEEKIEKLNTEIKTLKIEIVALTQTISTLNADKYKKSIDWNTLRSTQERLDTKNEALKAATVALETTQKNSAHYLETLRSDITDTHYLEKLVATHDQAQSDNKFDFEPYVKAICDIDPNDPALQDVLDLIDATTDAQTQAAIAKGVSPIEIGFTDKNGKTYSRAEVQALPFNKLTLIQKLNRFREKFTEHMQQEIIFNPNHILEGLKQNETVWDAVIAGRVPDPNNHAKRAVIFSQLVGWAQRKASEPVKQDLRQGTWYLTIENEPRSRQSRFNTWNSANSSIDRNSLIDVSISSPGLINGIGYKFAGPGPTGLWRACGWASAGVVSFQNLCRTKTTSFQSLLRSLCEFAPAGPTVAAR